MSDLSLYTPPWYLKNGHLQSIVPSLTRTVPGVEYVRERIDTPDGDFLDLDWCRVNGPDGARAPGVALVSHGLEGHSQRAYVRGMVRELVRAGWDVVAWNFRGCSGESNRFVRTYHSGETDDLHHVLTHALAAGGYSRASLVGFSMGGNQIMKYVGETPGRVPAELVACVGVSAPCDLEASVRALARPACAVYMHHLLGSLKQKMSQKAALFPGELNLEGLGDMRTFLEFDNRFTAPIFGFKDGKDYWTKCSCKQFLPGVRVPSLLLSSLDDPFLARECCPYAEARRNPQLTLETPAHGGHVGFMLPGRGAPYWSELRAAQFVSQA